VTQEDIIKRYYANREDCDPRHDGYKALASILATSSDAEGCEPASDTKGSAFEPGGQSEESGDQVSVVVSAPARDENSAAIEKLAVNSQLRGSSQRQSTKIAIKANGRIVFIDPDDVIAVESEGNYVSLQRRTDSYLLRESISVMAEILKPYGFVRIHRSVLVNSSFVEQIESRPTGAYGLRAKGGKEYTVTRTYRNNLKSLATTWIGTDMFLDE
jgi:hypothetical protein